MQLYTHFYLSNATDGVVYLILIILAYAILSTRAETDPGRSEILGEVTYIASTTALDLRLQRLDLEQELRLLALLTHRWVHHGRRVPRNRLIRQLERKRGQEHRQHDLCETCSAVSTCGKMSGKGVCTLTHLELRELETAGGCVC